MRTACIFIGEFSSLKISQYFGDVNLTLKVWSIFGQTVLDPDLILGNLRYKRVSTISILNQDNYCDFFTFFKKKNL